MRDVHHQNVLRMAAQRPPTAPALAGVQVYHPGFGLAVTLILLPPLIAVVAVGLSLSLFQRVALALPVALGLLLPGIASAWLAIVSVHTSPSFVGAARPWRAWRDMPWALITHASRRGPIVTLIASDGRQIRFVPVLLGEGGRLYRELLLRLPAQVLAGQMANDAQVLLAERILPTADGGLTGSLRARPRMRWRAAALLVASGALVAGVVGALVVRLPSALGIVMLACVALSGALLAFRWCAQTLDVSDDGLTRIYPLQRTGERMAWSEIQLVEHSPGERVLRLRGDRRLVCAGPALLRPEERDLLRAFLHTYCLNRGVPVARRRWLFPARAMRHR